MIKRGVSLDILWENGYNVLYMKKRPYEKSVYRSLALITQFGINMLVPICMMSAAGVFLDKRLGTSWITVLFFFIGAIAGGQNVYRMAKRVYASESSEKETRATDEQAERKLNDGRKR